MTAVKVRGKCALVNGEGGEIAKWAHFFDRERLSHHCSSLSEAAAGDLGGDGVPCILRVAGAFGKGALADEELARVDFGEERGPEVAVAVKFDFDPRVELSDDAAGAHREIAHRAELARRRFAKDDARDQAGEGFTSARSGVSKIVAVVTHHPFFVAALRR